MKFLHSMIRVRDLDRSLQFFVDILGLTEVRRNEVKEGQFTLVYLKTEGSDSLIELTYNWEPQSYDVGRNFGHLAFTVKNIYAFCKKLMDSDVIINRPPRDGRMAFVKSPDNISIEILQQGEALEIIDPWSTMKNIGNW